MPWIRTSDGFIAVSDRRFGLSLKRIEGVRLQLVDAWIDLGIECLDDFRGDEIGSFVLNDAGDNVNGLNLHVAEEAARRARHGSCVFEAPPQPGRHAHLSGPSGAPRARRAGRTAIPGESRADFRMEPERRSSCDIDDDDASPELASVRTPNLRQHAVPSTVTEVFMLRWQEAALQGARRA